MLVVYLSVELAYNVLRNWDNLLNNRLCNHLLDKLQVFRMLSYVLRSFLTSLSNLSFQNFKNFKCFFHRSKRYSLSFLELEENFLCVPFYRPHFQTTKWKVYLIPENLDELSKINIDFFFFLHFWLIFILVNPLFKIGF